MSIQDDLLPNEKFAETLEEEAQADNLYERQRDNDSEVLEESVKELIKKLNKLFYYKNRKEGLARDLINTILDELKLKIESVDDITPKFQSIRLIEVED